MRTCAAVRELCGGQILCGNCAGAGFPRPAVQTRRGGPLCAIGAVCGGVGRGALESGDGMARRGGSGNNPLLIAAGWLSANGAVSVHHCPGEKIFEDFSCIPKLLWYYSSVKTKMPFPKQNKKAVPSHLERVTNQWQPARTGGTAQRRVTDELTKIKDRNCRGFLPGQNSSKDQIGRPMVGQARISTRKPRRGCSDGGRGNRSQGGKADTMNPNDQDLGDIFGEPIAVYSRRQAIEDGVLVDLMQPETVGLVRKASFKFPVAMTVAAIGEPLPEGQDIQGRLWDVLWMLACAIKSAGSTDRVKFRVSVWNGRRREEVKLWASCGPGDDGEPVVTMMLEGED